MLTTFPGLLLDHADRRPDAPAIREKDLGIWQTLSWRRLRDEVAVLAAGLQQAGLGRGDHLAVIGENRPRLYAAMIAAQSIGAIPVPLYQDAAAQEMAFVFDNAQIRHAVVEDQEQVDKLLEVRDGHPMLEAIFYDDPRGLRHYDAPGLAPIERLAEAGAAVLQTSPNFLSDQVARVSPDDVAALFYTSGTTGRSKGVIHTHSSLITMSREAARLDGLTPDENVMAYLPIAWIGQNIFSYAQWLTVGFTINCPESQSTVMNDMREIGPTYYFAPPRVLEALLTQVTIRMEDAARPKRAMFRYFMDVAARVGGKLLDRATTAGAPQAEPIPLLDRLRYRLGDLLVYGPLRNALGMSRIRVAYTAGEAIGPDLFTFYRSLGINLKQLYGQTESAVFVCVQPNGQVKADTVGPPLEGIELKVASSGELLIRSPALLREYYRNPEATAEVLEPDGWYHTGDAGYLGEDGHLRIIDRAKDVGKLAGGQLFAPKFIENKLKFFPFIKEAVAFGDGRDRVMAFINIDYEACGNWAERRNLPYTGYVDLAGRPQIYDLVRDCVEKVNADLAGDPMMAASQIHRFLVLHKELDADDDELTRTRKVRRGLIAGKYAVLIDALYGGLHEQFIETQVRFEDGRTGSISATLRIDEARTFAPTATAARASSKVRDTDASGGAQRRVGADA
ncbi:MAG: AMP-binding protein [Burkholderiaceae bacterium]